MQSRAMKETLKYHGREVDWLTRSGDRLHVMATCQTLEVQIPDLEAPKPVKDVLNRCVKEMWIILEQAYYLDEEWSKTNASLREEKKLNLVLTMDNDKLQTKCSDQAKEIRTLKKSIEQLMR